MFTLQNQIYKNVVSVQLSQLFMNVIWLQSQPSFFQQQYNYMFYAFLPDINH